MKILVVEDLYIMRKILINTLNQMGYHDITEAEDGYKALKVLQQDKYGLLITDWLMPNIDGLELTKILRSSDNYKELPILMITTVSSKPMIIKALNAGVNNYVVKPFNQNILRAKIQATIDKESLHEEEDDELYMEL